MSVKLCGSRIRNSISFIHCDGEMTKQATKFDEKNSGDGRHGCDSIPISNSDIFRVPEFSLAHIMAVHVRKLININIHNYIYIYVYILI